MTGAVDDSIDSKSESILTDNVESIGVDGERAVPPTSVDTFLGFVSDVNHEAELTDDGVAESLAACNVVAALAGAPELVEKPETSVSGVLVLVVVVAGEVSRFCVMMLVVDAVDADLIRVDPLIVPPEAMRTLLELARTGSCE